MTGKLLKDEPHNIGDTRLDPDTGRVTHVWDGSKLIFFERELDKALRDRDEARAENANLREINELMRAAMHDIYEVYAGSEGFIPETCAEAYQQQLIKEMADVAGQFKKKCAAMGESE